MRSIQSILFCWFLVYSFYAPAQALTKNHYSKIIVEKKEELIVTSDSIQLDTLILKDHAKLKFTNATSIIIENAFIGEKCQFNSYGISGERGDYPSANGRDGEDGKKLNMAIRFKELKSLLINTSGGAGGMGASGNEGIAGVDGVANGSNGTNGQKGGDGGSGGRGGDLILLYVCDGFIPVFNEMLNHGIMFNYAGGKAGKGGNGGAGGRGGKPISIPGPNGLKVIHGVMGNKGANGLTGFDGKTGQEGQFVLRRID